MLPPLRFHAIVKARAWGGTRLSSYGKPAIPDAKVGESWEVADLPDTISDGQSRIASGPFAGLSLRELRSAHARDLLGTADPAPDGAFPLLVKFLDAAENLSVQVHPDASYVRAHPGAHLKTEAWIVLEAAPGARVYRGIRESTDADAFFAAVAEGRALDHLESFEVSRGDCIYLPSGTCHALGAGILAAEVQTPSDTTFRVWDWDRNDPARPLHLAEARACMKFGSAQRDGVRGLVRGKDARTIEAGGITTRRLCRSAFFTVEWLETRTGAVIPLAPTGVPEIWITAGGSARWTSARDAFLASAGSTVLRPAACEEGAVLLSANTVVIRATCASILDRTIA